MIANTHNGGVGITGRVWESHADTGARRIVQSVLADQMVATVATPPVGPDGLEALLRCLLPTTPGQASRNWRPCCSAYFRGRRFRPRGRDRAPFAEIGLRLCVSHVANRVTEWAGAPN